MATVTKRTKKDGSIRWQAKIRQPGQCPISRTFDFQSDARRWARETERDLERGAINVAATLAEKTKLYELLARYGREVTPEKKSARTEAAKLEMFARSSLGDLYISNITPQLIANWRDARLAQVRPPTVNRELNILGHVFTVAIKEWGITANWGNPVHLIRRPKDDGDSKHGRDRRLRDEEEQRLIEAAEQIEAESWQATQEHGSTPPIPLADIIRLAIETAMRRGEIAHVLRANLNRQARTLTIEDTKNGERRVIPLSTLALRVIDRQPAQLDGRIWPRLHENSITRAFAKARKRAGIEGLRLHDLRHEATTRFFERGFGIMEVASITGHKDMRMLQRYTHHDAARLARKLG